MPRKKQEMTKHTLNLRTGDFAFLQTIANSRGQNGAFVVRKIISAAVDKLRDKMEQESLDD